MAVYLGSQLKTLNGGIPVGSTTIEELNVTENGTYTAPTGKAYSPVNVNVSTNDMLSYFDKTITKLSYDGTATKSILGSMFKNYTTLQTVDLPNATSIGASAFEGCTGLTSINFPNATSIGASAFKTCNNLASAIFPKVTSVGTYAFQDCTKITSLKFSVLETVPANALGYISNTEYGICVLLLATSIKSDGLRQFKAKAIDLPVCTSLEARAIYGSVCQDLILRSDTVCSLSATSSVGVGASGGLTSTSKVYVPSSLISTYESASNWASAKTNKGFTFVAIEGSEYEHYYADGTPIS